MNHHAAPDFWACYRALPQDIRKLADQAYERLKQNPRHPSPRFKRIGRFWSARVGATRHNSPPDKFETERWRIECSPDRWQISTLSGTAAAEVIEIACSTFERLCETPISAFGLNYDHSGLLVPGTAPFERLMSTLTLESYALRQVAFGRVMDPISSSGVTLRRQLNAILEVKAEAPAVLHSNVHHDIELAQSGYFDEPPPLRTAYTDATSVTNALAVAVLAGEEAQNAHNA